jgi:hypothetical protein
VTIHHSVYRRATTGGHAGLSALIGTRCWPQRLEADANLPAMTYSIVSSPPSDYQDHDGGPDRWVYRVQLDGYADDPDSAASLGAQMLAAFAAWSSGTAVGSSLVQNHFETYEPALNRYRQVVDVVIDHRL